MAVLVTGAVGFIGYSICNFLLNRGESVIGVDNLNDYYDVNLKKARLNELKKNKLFTFYKLDIADNKAMFNLIDKNIDRVIHLAAQAGVRYSLENPYSYVHSNLLGHLTILEFCRNLPNLKHLVYASSSSVYGANTKLPFSVDDPVDHPISFYGATKRSDELMSYSYSNLFNIPATGLRFFTVYGPWGRPDMAAFIFTKSILNNEKIKVFNNGNMRRNFTYVDDVVDGTIKCLDNLPELYNGVVPHRIYNIGNNKSEKLLCFIETLEKIIGKKAIISFEKMQLGDVKETVADVTSSSLDFGFYPKTNIEEGLCRFVDWYRKFYAI